MIKLNQEVVNNNISKNLQNLYTIVIDTGQAIDCMAFKFFLEAILLLKVDIFEGVLNQSKIDGKVNGHLNSCNL